MKRLSRKQFDLLFNVIVDCGSKFRDDIRKRFIDVCYDFRFGRAKISVIYMAKCTYNFGEGDEAINTLIQFDCLFGADSFPERYVIRPVEVSESQHAESNIFDFLICPLKDEKGGVNNETEKETQA